MAETDGIRGFDPEQVRAAALPTQQILIAPPLPKFSFISRQILCIQLLLTL